MTAPAQGTPEAPAVLCRGLTKSFNGLDALRGVDLEIRRGEMFGLVGPDSAGKSTAIRILVGLLKPSSGRVEVLGCDLLKELKKVKQRIGYLSQAFTLYGDLTIDENMSFFADIHGVDDPARHDRLLEMTDLKPFRKRLAQNLSGGMKKKLALVCTLIHRPDVIFLDEPSTGVDPVSRGEFWNILSSMIADGLTVILTTPYLDEAERCHRIALLHSGRVMMTATPEEVRRRLPGKLYKITCEKTAAAYRILRHRWNSTQLVQYADHIRLWLDDDGAGASESTALLEKDGCKATSVEQTEPSLEDAFVGLIASEDRKEHQNET